jgi:threonine/homoserine/homoserine lactone efflux protein
VNLLFFLFKVFVISLSGVMAPGPVTAAAVAMGARRRYAGALITLGHIIIEFPLMILIILGMGKLLESTNTQIIVGLAGGMFLLIMAIQMVVKLNAVKSTQEIKTSNRPVFTGIVLSAGNPYFLMWWATIGMALATDAKGLGIWAFALFVIVHWLCDCVWFQALSWASFKGSSLLGGRSQRIVLLICSAALFVFGLLFIYKAGFSLIKLF